MSARAWLAIPAMGAIGAAAALATGHAPPAIAATGATGAAIAAAVRGFGVAGRPNVRGDINRRPRTSADDGDPARAGVVGAVAGAGAAITYALGSSGSWAAWIAVAAAAWTFAELARALPPDKSPHVALVPACIAAALDPSFVALILLAGLRAWRAPRGPRWLVALPVAGALAIGLALLSYRTGLAWHAWTARASGAPLAELPDTLGPLAAVAVIAGLAFVGRACVSSPAARPLALVAACAAIVAHQVGAVTPAVLAIAAIAIGIAIGRLAAIVRHPTGQICVGSLCALLLVVEPGWLALT